MFQDFNDFVKRFHIKLNNKEESNLNKNNFKKLQLF